MKCFLKNDCARKDWCCNFCNLKCNVRCKDDCKNCKWFLDEPVTETDEQGNVRLFKYVKDANGDLVRHYYSVAELTDELILKRSARPAKAH
ncbi:MAG: hypothetical protein NC132_03110 [Corallococcus sp.]|nr:hypothetical protein [Corallococcus sp.]MCM1359096.1 hypothetical protein [Corallococcus sp.]MCM1395085.1 hypothetical protein [Corallococcus sp.]